MRELVEDGTLVLTHVVTDEQLVDILTKGLDGNMFDKLRMDIGICSCLPNFFAFLSEKGEMYNLKIKRILAIVVVAAF